MYNYVLRDEIESYDLHTTLFEWSSSLYMSVRKLHAGPESAVANLAYLRLPKSR